MGDTDIGPPATPGIQVDVTDLAAFRAFLDRELSQNLSPAAQGIIREHSLGPGFGANSVSMQVLALHDQYARTLQISTLNMATYVRKAEALIDAMKDVMSNYQDSDLTADILQKAIKDSMMAVNLRDADTT
jgi:hypothetical protein